MTSASGGAIAPDSAPRSRLLRELEAYRASRLDADEAQSLERLAAFVAAHEDAMLRSCLEGHVTGSAFVTDARFERVLFVHHAKLGKWLQPGGHCEAGETAFEAAAREAFEETAVAVRSLEGLGIFDLDIHSIPERSGVCAHHHYDVRYLFVAESGLPRASEESFAVEWLDFEEASRRNPERSIRRALGKLERLRSLLARE